MTIAGNNYALASVGSGTLTISGANYDNVAVGSGMAVIAGENRGSIKVGSGSATITGENSGDIAIDSGEAIVKGRNSGKLVSRGGGITVGDMQIRIRRMTGSASQSVRYVGDCVTQIVGPGAVIIGGTNTGVINTGVIVTSGDGSGDFVGRSVRHVTNGSAFVGGRVNAAYRSDQHLVLIDDVVINVTKGTITRFDREVKFADDSAVVVDGDAIELTHKGHLVRIDQESVTVNG